MATKQVLPNNKAVWCEQLAELVSAVNELAVNISTSDDKELQAIWQNLANARAYLTTALTASRQLKPANCRGLVVSEELTQADRATN